MASSGQPLRNRSAGLSGGFTLIELMVVVVIIAVLAGVAIVAYTRHIKSARLISAQGFIADIRARQEAYYQQYGAYAAVSANGAYYPALTTGEPVAKSWAPTPPGDGHWEYLSVKPEGRVTYFQYRVTASAGPDHALDGIASALGVQAQPGGGMTPHPWYYVIGRGNLDGQGTCSEPPPADGGDCTMLYGISTSSEIITANEGK